jgi:hypothetical protein
MPLQNRVSPLGELFASSVRGTMMGNRGGRIHDGNRTLSSRRWASRQWICCVLDFNDRHRKVWGHSYTELFFLDEVTAFAAGHRPCFECRHTDAMNFARLFGKDKSRVRAAEMDRILHAERLDGKTKRVHRLRISELPDGAFIVLDEKPFALKSERLLRWTPSGYRAGKSQSLPRSSAATVDVLTPPAVLRVLQKGYGPRWHPSAGR